MKNKMKKTIITLYFINLITFIIFLSLHIFEKNTYILHSYLLPFIRTFNNLYFYHLGISFLLTTILCIILNLKFKNISKVYKFVIILSTIIYYLVPICMCIIALRNMA